MEEKEENLLVAYAIYTMLYCNNLAYNCIIELKPFVDKKDKETRKIYGALYKRVRNYYCSFRDVLKEANDFFGCYNSLVDDINDDTMEEYRDSIIEAYYKGGIKEYEFLGYLETARSMFYFSISTIDALIEKTKTLGIDVKRLKDYSLGKYSQILDNLVKWCYRNAVKEVSDTLDLTQDKDVMNYFTKINENLLNFDTFYECYNKAFELTEKDNGLYGKENDARTSASKA